MTSEYASARKRKKDRRLEIFSITERADCCLQAGDVIRVGGVTGVQTCALPIAETGMPTRVVADPLGVVVEGAGIILENFSRYGEMIFGDDGN